jgi:hypothetical protein
MIQKGWLRGVARTQDDSEDLVEQLPDMRAVKVGR